MNKFSADISENSTSTLLNSLQEATTTTLGGITYGLLSLLLYAAPMATIYLVFKLLNS